MAINILVFLSLFSSGFRFFLSSYAWFFVVNDDFVKATFTVWAHLIRDPYIRDLVELDSRARDRTEEVDDFPSFPEN